MSIRDWFKKPDNDASTIPDEWGALLTDAEGTHVIYRGSPR